MCFAVCLFSSLEYANFLVFVGTCVSLATSHCHSVGFYIALWVVSVTNSAFLLFWWVPAHITDLALFSSDFMFITDSAHHQRTQMFIPISLCFLLTSLPCAFSFQFMVQSQMSRLKLTKIITVLPFFLVINQSNRKLRYMEENPQADLWLDIAKGDVSLLVCLCQSVCVSVWVCV